MRAPTLPPPDRSHEAALVAAAQAHPAAFAALYQLHYPAIYRYAHRRTGDLGRAEEIAAETFLAAWQALPRYEWRGSPFSAWLYRIAAIVIAGQYRRAQGVICVPLDSHRYPWVEPISAEPGPAARLEERERQQIERALLRRALRCLTSGQRQALQLRYSGPDLLPLAQIATHMQRSEGAVKLLLHRALRALRRALADLPSPDRYPSPLAPPGAAAPGASRTPALGLRSAPRPGASLTRAGPASAVPPAPPPTPCVP